MLPELKKIKPLAYFTPQKWQTVLLRNYGLVDNKTIASVLGTDEKTIVREANRLGINKIKFNSKWKKQGYINIIKNNWHLVPYNQLLELLDMDEETLDYNLKEDDFLGIKLGLFKTELDEVKYSPLSSEEIKKTEKLAKVIKNEFIDDYAEPFDFYSDTTVKFDETSATQSNPNFDKIVYSYSMLYGDTFMEGDEIVPDEFLQQLQAVGVNGLWMQGLLSKLSPYPFVKGLDKGYEIRRQNLNKIIAKCKKYGIGVYLYFNEPRGISDDQLTPETEKIKGRFFEGSWSLCSETKPVKEYLYNAVKSLAEAVPDLAGIITITMSENMTNCHSRTNNPCPICNKKKHQDVVPEINNIIQRAITDAGAKTRVLANLWGWGEAYDWSPEDVKEGIANMDKKIDVLSVSELGHITIDGERRSVDEYALSKVGPCEETVANLAFAKEAGHKIMAKVQINNSWEIAVTPYIPVFDLIIEHMTNLKNIGVGGLMMSWTLGGYPTVSLDLVNKIFSNNFNYDEWLKYHFEDHAKLVKEAVKYFSEGFRHFPHTIGTLYQGAQELGPSNLLYAEKTGYNATMVTYAHDDYNAWRGYYSVDSFFDMLDSLLNNWQKGLDILKAVRGNDELVRLKRYAEVIYVNIKSMFVQTEYNIAREGTDKDVVIRFLEEERELARRLYRLAAADARVGYEASNHYYFTQNNFLEKFINIEYLLEDLKKDQKKKSIEEYLSENWDKTVRFNPEDDPETTLIGLPYPYTVPCAKGAFNELYYWDTYFANKGLIISGKVDLAENNCKNMLYLVEKYGYMLNGNRQWYVGGSQPPYLTLMVKDVYDVTKNIDFLKNAYPTLIKEYSFWMEKRIAPNGLNRYYNERPEAMCIDNFKGVAERITPVGGEDPVLAGKHYFAEGESGWDFCARFSGKCMDYNPVDLNSIIYATEKTFAEIERILGVSDGEDWEEIAKERKEKMDKYLWDKEKEIYLDYNHTNGTLSKVPSAASFWPYFLSVADENKIDGLKNALKILEADYAILTAIDTGEHFQWGYPNAWAPCNFATVIGLLNYGLKEDALRVAEKYVRLIETNFEATGGLWEKYNANTGGIDVVSEYGTPEMMGWTAGVYTYFKQVVLK